MKHYLKSTDQATLIAALVAAKILFIIPSAGDMPERLALAPGFDLDMIGVIHKPTGEVRDVDGEPTAMMAPIDGLHANLRGELTGGQASMLPLIPQPTNITRDWA